MSSSQPHGKVFEIEVITTCFGVPIETAKNFKSGEIFDIPMGVITCKHPTGNPVSIKTAALKAASKAAAVCLADASRVWRWNGPLILVVGVYSQVKEEKHVHTVHEFTFVLDADERLVLYGSVTPAEVEDFHKKLREFKHGDHVAARAWAKLEKKKLAQRIGVIQLNPKIDSKTQKRLQCSAPLSGLILSCKNHKEFSENYKGLALPYIILGGIRQFANKTTDNEVPEHKLTFAA